MYKGFFKRLFDLLLAIIALPLLLIIFAILGPIIYFQDRGTIFYNAPRLGKDGKVFKMYKLRSMKINVPDLRNEDGSTFNAEDDPRLTRIGKFIRKTSLDETPQLLNIIKGDMSIIGPRPDLPEHCDLYKGNEERKLEIKPGVTGYNQAYFRNTIPWKERIQNDIYYIDHLSLWLDIKIFFKTTISVLKREDVFVTEKRTSSKNNTDVGM
ncbi:sugar transferase [Gracilibacillus salitolerans]|uniref:Sugar transferase n=1 Tax=Gracilibacillus salitolerans TaxID=2663022 RepID=A0A5Q2TQ59_9BACI|nr:sugar transferase [Gracilibacillus salitolerans]QGH36267.1 sugar transferase [Gracilibacillus salitolerans]